MEIIYRHFDSLPSTNDWAKAHLDTFCTKALTVISADEQTQGRGRYGKKWLSPAQGNLYATFAFFASHAEPVEITRLLAVTTSHILEERGIISQIKWPNDLLVNQKKIAGILCETTPPQGIIIGIGLNVNMPTASLTLIDQPATSLLNETGVEHDVGDLLSILAEHFAINLRDSMLI